MNVPSVHEFTQTSFRHDALGTLSARLEEREYADANGRQVTLLVHKCDDEEDGVALADWLKDISLFCDVAQEHEVLKMVDETWFWDNFDLALPVFQSMGSFGSIFGKLIHTCLKWLRPGMGYSSNPEIRLSSYTSGAGFHSIVGSPQLDGEDEYVVLQVRPHRSADGFLERAFRICRRCRRVSRQTAYSLISREDAPEQLLFNLVLKHSELGTKAIPEVQDTMIFGLRRLSCRIYTVDATTVLELLLNVPDGSSPPLIAVWQRCGKQFSFEYAVRSNGVLKLLACQALTIFESD